MTVPRPIDRSLDRLAELWFHNTALEWLTALGMAALVGLVVTLARRLVARRRAVAPAAPGPIREWIGELARTLRSGPIWIFALYLASLSLHLPARLEAVLKTVAVFTGLLQFGLWAAMTVDLASETYRRRRLESDAGAVTVISTLGFVAKLVAWALLLLVALENLGVNVTTLVAGLGVTGIAVALALQRILGDVLAALSIVVDKPFVIGDSIQVGDLSGTVTRVGLRTTRLQSVSGEELIFANSDLLQSRIRNFKRMTERRTLLAWSVSLATPAEKLRKIPALVREIIEAQGENVRFDRAHLRGIGAYSFDFEAVYFVLSPEYALFADLQQAVYFALVEGLEAHGIELATNAPLPKRVPEARPEESPGRDQES